MKHFGFDLAKRGAGNTVQSVVEAETIREGIVLAEHAGEVELATEYAETNHR